MIVRDGQASFRNRRDAGQQLAKMLGSYKDEGAVVVYAIPRGGVPVAVEVAKQLGSQLDIIIPRKIPIPSNTEAGYGAVTEDGVIVLNESLVQRLQLTPRQIERHAEEIKAEINRRSAAYRTRLAPTSAEGKTAIIVDDGLASGYTMMAAIKSIRQRGAAKAVAAAPVASSSAWELIASLADDVVCPIVSRGTYFAVASFYEHWHDLTDEEVFASLDEYTNWYEGHTNRQQGAL